jgi:N-acetylmuramoyl-L-alanine amidase
MSASPTRVAECDVAMDGDADSPLQEGNRVLASIARQEALPALLAFSELHQQIRNRHAASSRANDRDLFETERFILDEVLQLICDRAQAITQADCIVVALAKRSESKRPEMICRAAAGAIHVARGARLIGESEFLREALESGRILRCDDGESDARVELDFAHQLGARSTVLIPLRGRREQLGVLQAFSTSARAFADHDVRCLELLAELVLSALRPEDQDRRIQWLSDVADEVLQTTSTAEAVEDVAEVTEPPAIEPLESIAGSLSLSLSISVAPIAAATAAVPPPSSELASPLPEPDMLAQAVEIPAPATELIEESVAEHAPELALEQTTDSAAATSPQAGDTDTSLAPRPFLFSLSLSRPWPSFARNLPRGLHPGLNVVMGLVAVAALFSAGAWWGMQAHGNSAMKIATANTASANAANPPQSVTAPAPPRAEALMPVAADNLMNSVKLESDSGVLTAVAPDKLAALPKITGVRHWASSLGSTVVIDMEDQVPYEVHRLMSPERIYFDLHDTVLSHELDGKTMDVGDVSLTRVRVAQPVAGLTRIVLDTRDGANFSISMESNPYRLVVELRGSEKTLTAHSAAPGRTTPHVTNATAHQPSLSANATAVAAKAVTETPLGAKAPGEELLAKTGKFRIVLDAGHGGWDLGTVGRQGLLEKDLVLDVTRRLGKLLQTRLGSEILFTRDNDAYMSLDQRADFANQAQADVFVSVHANYSKSAAARGVETYYTNLFSAPGSREVEKHEDGSFSKLTPVSLSSGGLHEKIEESRKLATSVQRSLYATLAANSSDIRNRGIKDSAFVVLTGTTMPAILTEISFVSSPADEHNLQSATYRQQIAEALYQGIARYQQSSPHTRVAQLQTTAARR